MEIYYSIEKQAFINYELDDSGLRDLWVNLPGISYSILVTIYSIIYRKIATKLTDFENHRNEESYQKNLVLKYCVFEFINNFVANFYLLFYYQDIAMLKSTIRNFFIVQIVINHFLETYLPYKNIARKTKSTKIIPDEMRENYETTFDEYLEMWLQFGHIVLFASVHPASVVLALVNNIIEIRTDLFKIISTNRLNPMEKPFGLGSWRFAFQAMVYIGVLSNTLLILMDEEVQLVLAGIMESSGFFIWVPENLRIFAFGVLIEHVLIGGMYLAMKTKTKREKDLTLRCAISCEKLKVV